MLISLVARSATYKYDMYIIIMPYNEVPLYAQFA